MTYDVLSTATPVSPAKTGDAREAITAELVADKARWDSLIASCPDPHLPQGFAYGEGKAAKGWTVRRVVFLEAGRPVAIATVLEFRRFGLHLVNRVNRGPLFLDAAPDAAEIVGVYAALRRRWGRIWTAPLLIAPALPLGAPSDALLRSAGYRLRHRRSWQSGRIDLTVGEDALWAGLASTFRNRVRNAEKAGAELRIAQDDATYEWMLARHAENMAERGFTAADPTLLRALRVTAPEDVSVFQLLHQGEPVAGMSVVRFGTHAEYHVGWFGPAGRKLNAGNFLMWQVLRDMHRRGVRTFDVGGLKPGDGYTRFKQTMKPVEYQLAGEWMSW
ncbi:GNAT family N-acetyltransferase [Devosia sp. Root413D1]|uniref:lipid II:glycine glycyltransferase FemX n=1 Tax=Devosia sp. Root413D1 TaxID=1736531 RepID=UPI0009EB3718|nr:GNAT family N-acetyltransferase [Devosia sp. Root413D1]